MTLFQILQIFLSPSVFVPGLLLISFIFLLNFKNKRMGKIFVIIGFILCYFFSITPGADLILLPLENQYSPIKENDFNRAEKVVLFLGGGEHNILRASEILRIYAAKFQNPNPNLQIIISGEIFADGADMGEAEKTKLFLVERGIPAERIILENKSKNTFESAKNVTEMLHQEPFFLVTSAYHMPRSIKSFQHLGANPIPAPTDFKTRGNYNLLSYFPNAGNLTKADLAFHEYFGILSYKFFRF